MSNLEENSSIQSGPDPDLYPGPWPWYVLLATGYSLSGLFPWLLVLWAAFRRGKKRAAFLGLILNLGLYCLLALYAVKAGMPWWWLSTSILGINLIWAVGAWIFQRIVTGIAPPRYLWRERSAWLSPLVIGLVLGMALSIVMGIPEALTKRQEMRTATDILDRSSVLWILLGNAYKGIPFGLLLGLWWAGEKERFSVSHVITFLCAGCATLVFLYSSGLLLVFLLTKGVAAARMLAHAPEWALNPPWISGWPKVLTLISRSDFLTFLVIPLLFGAVPRLRDFFKRLLWLPAVLLISLPFFYVHTEWWNVFQSQIVCDMSSPDADARAGAYDEAELLLVRYPEHLQWPAIAEVVARYRYENGRFDTARALYESIIARFKGCNQWTREVKRAEAALGSSGFGRGGAVTRLEIPMVDYETYLTHNWMALLSVVRYWEGPRAPESNVKIKLKSLSKSDDKIVLNPLATVADLDDAVRSLNHRMTILPSNLSDLEALLAAGIPVILIDKERFCVLYGVDGTRSAVLAYGFDNLSFQTRQEAHKEAKEILALKAEGHGESKERLDRIRYEVQDEYSFDFWEEPILGYRAPFMAAITPESRAGEMASILGRPIESIVAESKGALAAFIGLAFLQHADPLQALEWAKISSSLISSPLPFYVGGLSELYWRSKEKRIKTGLAFESQFPELKETGDAFNAPENAAFLEKAKLRFEADFKAGTLPSSLLDGVEKTLVPEDPDDQETLIHLGRLRVTLDPKDTDGWKMLAWAFERKSDLPGRTGALEGHTASDPLNFNAKLDLAMTWVLRGEPEKAERVLKTTDREKIRFNADYPFCLGAIAEGKSKRKDALEYYRKAIDMRRYKPVYHLRYGRLLLAEGRKEDAGKALRWAALTDATGTIKAEAERLLAE